MVLSSWIPPTPFLISGWKGESGKFHNLTPLLAVYNSSGITPPLLDHLLQELHRVTFILPDNTHRYHLWPGHPTITTLHGWIFFLCTWSSVAIIFSGSVITGEGVKVLSTRWEVRRTKQLSSSSSQLKILPLDQLNSILGQELQQRIVKSSDLPAVNV